MRMSLAQVLHRMKFRVAIHNHKTCKINIRIQDIKINDSIYSISLGSQKKAVSVRRIIMNK